MSPAALPKRGPARGSAGKPCAPSRTRGGNRDVAERFGRAAGLSSGPCPPAAAEGPGGERGAGAGSAREPGPPSRRHSPGEGRRSGCELGSGHLNLAGSAAAGSAARRGHRTVRNCAAPRGHRCSLWHVAGNFFPAVLFAERYVRTGWRWAPSGRVRTPSSFPSPLPPVPPGLRGAQGLSGWPGGAHGAGRCRSRRRRDPRSDGRSVPAPSSGRRPRCATSGSSVPPCPLFRDYLERCSNPIRLGKSSDALKITSFPLGMLH